MPKETPLSAVLSKIDSGLNLKLSSETVEKIMQAKEPEDLYEHLQNAIKLEHATIPPYLTALYSIKSNSNKEVAQIIFSVVRQEMLHMTIAANVLNALGGEPKIGDPDFIPTYPGMLPMIEEGPLVGLAPLSMDLVKNVFMRIELPEDPTDFPHEKPSTLLQSGKPTEQNYRTIGQFYSAIIERLKENPDWIKEDLSRQVVNPQWFSSGLLFPISNYGDAVRALEIIIDQGEGTEKGENPLDSQGNIAHYYKFSEIAEGARLYRNSSGNFVYDESQPIKLDESCIWELVENSKAADYEPRSVPRRMVDQFNYSYTSLLKGLHRTFNGEPNYLNTVMGLMFELKLQAEKMAERKIEPADLEEGVSRIGKVGKYLAPSFEYAPTLN
jgi:hypothetical protein